MIDVIQRFEWVLDVAANGFLSPPMIQESSRPAIRIFTCGLACHHRPKENPGE
jgi:hypothetical protein